MEVKEAIMGRTSVRKFTDEEVSRKDIEELIEVAMYAPSACNQQGWKFIVLDDDEIKNQIYEKHYSRLVKESKVGILVLYRKDVSFNYLMYKDHVQSAAAAIQNILLMAYEKGIGSCWVCDLPPKRVLRKLLHIPANYDVIAYIAMGYQEEYLSQHTLEHYDNDVEKAKKRLRKKTVEEILSYNVFENEEQINKNMFIKACLFSILKHIKNKEIKRIIVKIIGCRKDIIK
jgi:nitroreductase